MVAKIKTGDKVKVITGDDKNKVGVVLSRKDDLVVVEGVNVVKKTIKRNPEKNVEGGFKEISKPVHVSNVAIYDESSKKHGRIGIKTLSNGERKRYNKRLNEEVQS